MKKSGNYWKNLRSWWATFLGQAFMTAEAQAIKKIMPSVLGYEFLLCGEACFVRCAPVNPKMHKIWLHPHANLETDCSALTGRYDKLPVISDGIDVVYLAHVLESMKNPHEVLRETFRVLIPEGYILISHFNPWSFWGWWHGIVRVFKKPLWGGKLISMSRLKDWLVLLGFDTIAASAYFFRPPVAHPGTLKRLKWLEKAGEFFWPCFGGGYVILARKRVITLTPIRPSFKTKWDILVTGLIEPARSE